MTFSFELSEHEQALLLEAARGAIVAGLEGEPFREVAAESVSAALSEQAAVFVTLTINNVLRGCMGTMEACDTLLQETGRQAWAAAFADARFPSLRQDELANVRISISVVGELESLEFEGESDAISMLRPGIDGVVLRVGDQEASYLPRVWKQMPDPSRFIRGLKQKAGLSADAWPAGIELLRFETTSFNEPPEVRHIKVA